MAYSAASDVYLVFGRVNTRKWADADNDQDSDNIDARIAWAIELADAEIDARLSVIYTVLPLSTAPILIANISAMFAGVNLYGLPRAFAEGEDAAAIVAAIHGRATDMLDKIVMGKLRLNAVADEVVDVMEVIPQKNEIGVVVSS